MFPTPITVKQAPPRRNPGERPVSAGRFCGVVIMHVGNGTSPASSYARRSPRWSIVRRRRVADRLTIFEEARAVEFS